VAPATVGAGSINSQAAALRWADDLLTLVKLPAGSSSLPASPVSILDHPPDYPDTPNLAAPKLFKVLPMPRAAAVSYFESLTPVGFNGGGAPGSIGNVNSSAPDEQFFTWWVDIPSLPDGVDSAELQVSLADGAQQESFARIDAQVTWRPVKPLDEQVPVRDRVAVVTLSELFGSNGGPSPRHILLSDGAAFRALVASADALHTQLPGTTNCGFDIGTRYTIAFAQSAATVPDLTLAAGDCNHVDVTARGRTRPQLADNPAFSTAYLAALGLPNVSG
jgi:hypothetical protein